MRKKFSVLFSIVLLLLLIGYLAKVKIETREFEVIKKFNNEQNIAGTDKFIEDSYKLYPDSSIISAIYNYSGALQCSKFAETGWKKIWEDKARMHVANIPDDYQGELRSEMDKLTIELLGNNPKLVKKKIKAEEEKFMGLSNKDKRDIKEYINSRYDYYDNIEEEYLSDKYTYTIWEEASVKFDIPYRYIDVIWSDYNL